MKKKTTEEIKEQIKINAIADIHAEQKAFDDANIKYGTIEFIHSCGGIASATRFATPHSPAHRFGGGGSCEKCGVNWVY